jgi:hypothetical protein
MEEFRKEQDIRLRPRDSVVSITSSMVTNMVSTASESSSRSQHQWSRTREVLERLLNSWESDIAHARELMDLMDEGSEAGSPTGLSVGKNSECHHDFDKPAWRRPEFKPMMLAKETRSSSR